MGDQRRLKSRARSPLAAAVLCALLAALGCGKDETVERRRQLLTPSKAHQEAVKAKPKPTIYDQRGELLPSTEVVAGLVLPQGLELHSSRDNEWRYRTDKAGWEVLERYFEKRLVAEKVERMVGAVTFGNAAPTEDPQTKQRLTVHVEGLKGSPVASRVVIRLDVSERPKFTPEEADAKLEQMRRQGT
jgi:hypothetical protein